MPPIDAQSWWPNWKATTRLDEMPLVDGSPCFQARTNTASRRCCALTGNPARGLSER